MARSTTLSIRVAPEVKEQLDRLAKASRRTQSFLAGEAIAAFVARETELLQGVEEDLEDFRTGNTVSHEEAMAELQAVIDAARKRK
jgi:predicted transcriptional regulator